MITKSKIPKKQVVKNYIEKITTTWSELTLDEVRKEIFHDCQVEVNTYDIQKVLSDLGIRRNLDVKKVQAKTHWGEVEAVYYTNQRRRFRR